MISRLVREPISHNFGSWIPHQHLFTRKTLESVKRLESQNLELQISRVSFCVNLALIPQSLQRRAVSLSVHSVVSFSPVEFLNQNQGHAMSGFLRQIL